MYLGSPQVYFVNSMRIIIFLFFVSLTEAILPYYRRKNHQADADEHSQGKLFISRNHLFIDYRVKITVVHIRIMFIRQ